MHSNISMSPAIKQSPFLFKTSKTQMIGSFENDTEIIIPQENRKNSFDRIDAPTKFRGSFSQAISKTPDTPVFGQEEKGISNLKSILEKRDFETMNIESSKKKQKPPKFKAEMLNPRISNRTKRGNNKESMSIVLLWRTITY